MGTPTIIILVTLIVILATLLPSYLISKKKGVTESEWAIGARALPLYVVVGTQFASSMGGGILVGQVGNAYSNGIGMLLYAILAEIPILCIIFVGKWLRSHNYTTIPELLGTFSRKNKAVTITAALMSLIVPFGWVTSQITFPTDPLHPWAVIRFSTLSKLIDGNCQITFSLAHFAVFVAKQ